MSGDTDSLTLNAIHTRSHLKNVLQELTSSDSMPINQSGEGIIFVTSEMSELLLCTKSRESILSIGLLSFGMLNSSKTIFELFWFSHSLVFVVSQNSFRPGDATVSTLKRVKLVEWLTPKDCENCAGGRTSGKCLGNVSRLQWPSSVTLYTASESLRHFPPKLSMITLSVPSQVTLASTWKITSTRINILRPRIFDAFIPLSKHSRYWNDSAAIWFPQFLGGIHEKRPNKYFFVSWSKTQTWHTRRSQSTSSLSRFVMGEIILKESFDFRIKAWSWPTFIIYCRCQRFHQSRKISFLLIATFGWIFVTLSRRRKWVKFSLVQ